MIDVHAPAQRAAFSRRHPGYLGIGAVHLAVTTYLQKSFIRPKNDVAKQRVCLCQFKRNMDDPMRRHRLDEVVDLVAEGLAPLGCLGCGCMAAPQKRQTACGYKESAQCPVCRSEGCRTYVFDPVHPIQCANVAC